MNIGVIGKNISDIKLFIDLNNYTKNNYYYVYNEDYNNITKIINYLIENYNINTFILIDNKINTKNLQVKYNNILILSIDNIVTEYINDFNISNRILLINDYKVKDLNSLDIENKLFEKKDSVIVESLNKALGKIQYKYDYILSLNSRIDRLFNLLDVNIKPLNIITILKYILSKYNKVEKSSTNTKIYVYTTSNKNNIKEKLLNNYNIELPIKFINISSDYLIDINNFSGPMDLLLNLIKESNMNIYDINISEITDQYLEYIKKMEELNINIASSYLVMASELMYLKSNELLPKNETIKEDEEELTKDELINRLIEYKKYKELTSYFKEMENEGAKYLTKLPTKINVDNDELNSDINIDDLLLAFNKFLKRKKEDEPLKTTVTKKEYSVNDRCISIKKILKEKKKITFDELFDIKSKSYVIVSFLSVLELLKNETNRKARIEHTFAYCEPGEEPVVFTGVGTGTIAKETRGTRGRWHDKFYIPDGETRTLSELRDIDYEYEASFWGTAKDDFAKWYIENKLK